MTAGAPFVSLNTLTGHRSPKEDLQQLVFLCRISGTPLYRRCNRRTYGFAAGNIGFKQSSLHHVARVLQDEALNVFGSSPASTACYCPLQVSPPGEPLHSRVIFLQPLLSRKGIQLHVTQRTHEHVQGLERERRHGEQIGRLEMMSVVAQEGAPGLA